MRGECSREHSLLHSSLLNMVHTAPNSIFYHEVLASAWWGTRTLACSLSGGIGGQSAGP